MVKPVVATLLNDAGPVNVRFWDGSFLGVPEENVIVVKSPEALRRILWAPGVVEEKLEEWWSPQQVVFWLQRTYPDHQEMQVSHETIYLSLFVQGKGALRRELTDCLRTGRAFRRPKTKRAPSGKGQIVDPVMISERPAEVEDRAVPGHWEGDLLMGRRQTAIGTLVERHTRYVMLFPLPDGNTAEAVRNQLAASRAATIRSDTPPATPREISSRSNSDKRCGDRLLASGRTPPQDSTNALIDAAERPRSRPINRFATPACHRSQTSTRSSSVNLTTTTS